MNNAMDGMTIFNCGLKFQNATHGDPVKKYELWLDNLSSRDRPILLIDDVSVK